MSGLPEIRPARLAEPGTLAGDWMAGAPAARKLLPPLEPSGRDRGAAAEPPASAAGSPPAGGERSGTPGRLGADAFGTSTPAAAEKLGRILAGEGVLVSTGQQPVLFLGPLYVLYKLLTAVETARRLEEATGRPALASFWIASDDHDWAEVAGTRLLDTENRLRHLRLEPPAGWAERPVGPAPLPEGVDDLLQEVSDILPPSEFTGVYLTLLRDTYRPGVSFSAAFAAALAELLGERPWAWLDASHPTLKRASVPLLARALEESDAAEAALRAGAAEVEGAGYAPAIPVLDEGVPAFEDTGRRRERLYRRGGEVRAGRDGEPRPLGEVLARLEGEPETFSPNVSLRPVLESRLLPVAATVLGPGELSYWSQLGPLFAWAGVGRPAAVPRASWTLLEGKVAKVLEKLDAAPEELADGGGALVERETRRARPPPVQEALAALRADAGRALGRVEGAVEAELPGIRSAVGKARKQVFDAVAELETRVDARIRERQSVVVDQIHKAAVHLFPEGSPQERRLSPFYYLARYGGALLDAVEERTRAADAGGWPA